jgi:hypothetical protein
MLLSTSWVDKIVDYKGFLGSKVGWIPALRWFPAYTTRRFGLDLIAGLSLAAFVIPESLASEMQRHRMGMITNFLRSPLVNLVWG